MAEDLTIRLNMRDVGKGSWVDIQPQVARQGRQGCKLLGMVLAGSLGRSFLIFLLSACSLSHQHVTLASGTCSPLPALSPLCGVSFAHSDPRRDRGHLFAALCLSNRSSCTTRGLFSSHPPPQFAGELGAEAWTQVGWVSIANAISVSKSLYDPV